MRMRLLLLKQNKLTVLEQELAKVDASEERAIFLGSLRRDTNFERLKIIQELEIALKSYGKSGLLSDVSLFATRQCQG